jgi:hypothetical protein
MILKHLTSTRCYRDVFVCIKFNEKKERNYLSLSYFTACGFRMHGKAQKIERFVTAFVRGCTKTGTIYLPPSVPLDRETSYISWHTLSSCY